MVSKQDSFGFVYCGASQFYRLKVLFEEQATDNRKIKVTQCVVKRKPFPTELNKKNTRAPLSSFENAIHIVVGDPQWANYGEKAKSNFD